MTLVGPRPERPSIAAEYEEEMPEFRLRLQAKAGLTGYAQVYGKYNTTPYDKLLMDLMYISHPSFLEDFTDYVCHCEDPVYAGKHRRSGRRADYRQKVMLGTGIVGQGNA